nr:hypothetical protein [Lacticaseibacillus manihotivorans]
MLQKAGIDPDAARYVLEYLGDFTPTQLQLHGRDVMPDPIAKRLKRPFRGCCNMSQRNILSGWRHFTDMISRSAQQS